MQASVNVVHFDRPETVGDFMQRMRADQEVANRYEHTPLSLALAQLSDADRNALMAHGLSQLFNYVPNTRGFAFAKLIPVQDEMNADTGLHWDFTYLGGGYVEVFVRWDGCHPGKAEVGTMLSDIEKVLVWVSEPDHWESSLDERTRENRYRVDTYSATWDYRYEYKRKQAMHVCLYCCAVIVLADACLFRTWLRRFVVELPYGNRPDPLRHFLVRCQKFACES